MIACETRARFSKYEQGQDISALITHLADQIGQSIAAELQPEANDSRNTDSPERPKVNQPLEMSMSNVKLVMQSEAKVPPLFRVDGSDNFTVCEWEIHIMTTYLRKRGFPSHEHSQEIMSRLLGKVSDVVNIRLRNDSSIKHVQTPSIVYDSLKKHFGGMSCSNMPLADFYDTYAAPGESAMDYWICVNKAMDMVDVCLRKRGHAISDPSHEVCLMFI